MGAYSCFLVVTPASAYVLGQGLRTGLPAHYHPHPPTHPSTRIAVTALVAAFVCLFPQQPLEATAHALAYFG